MNRKLLSSLTLRTCSFLVAFVLLLSFQSQSQVGNYTTSLLTGVAPEDMNGFSPLFLPPQDNTASAVQNIGFNFTFNNIVYTQFSTNSNGLMRLGSTAVSTNAVNQLTVNSDFPKIAPYWDDLNTGPNGYSGYKLIGTAPNRKLLIEWILAIPKNSTTNAGRFQVWLFESTNVVQFVYSTGMTVNSGTSGYSVGLSTSTTDYISVVPSGATATFSKTVESNSITAAITSGVSYKFTPPIVLPGCATNLSPATGATGVSKATSISWAAGTGSPTSYDVYFGTSTIPPLVASGVTSTTYTPSSTLTSNTTYYYQIIPRNASGPATGCSIISFTSAPTISYDVVRTTGTTFTSISGTGTSATGWKNGFNTDDNLSVPQPVGFNFNYQGVAYSSFCVSTNGFITFNTGTTLIGNGSGNYSYTNGVASSGGILIIAPFYEDLVCQGNAGLQANLDAAIKYSVAGSAGSRIFTIEWSGMEIYNHSGPNLNFQLKLYEATSQIEYVYGLMDAFVGTSNYVYSYTIGLNGVYVSASPLAGEYINQLTPNTRNFGTPSLVQLNEAPICYSSLKFTLGSPLPYTSVTIIPSNDLKANAQHLDVGLSPCTDYCNAFYSSQNATSTPSLVACAGGNADDDVWFEFVATNANTTIKVVGGGNYDPAVELYNSSNVLVTCKDSSGLGLTEVINTTNLVLSQQYFLRVYHNQVGSGTGSGQFGICVSATPAPPINDNCSNAISLPVTSPTTFTTGTQTFNATASLNIPSCSLAGTSPDDDVWYSFVATNTIEIIKVSGGNGFDAVIQLLTGNCAALTALQCVNAYANGQIETLTANNLIKGQTYYIRVYHAGVGGGTGLFSINVTTSLPGCTSFMNPPTATSFIPHTGTTLSWKPIANANSYKIYLDLVNPPLQLLIQTTDTFAITGLMQQGANYYWRVDGVNTTGSSVNCDVLAFATEPLDYALQLKVFVEGIYSTITHSQFPVLNPSDTLSDSITVVLANPTTKLAQYTSKGVLSTNGIAFVLFPQPALQQTYYIVVKHRNSLDTWSASTFGFNAPDTLYDFTSSASKAYGSNLVLVEPGVYAIHTGDINQDGIININDLLFEETKISSSSIVGYLPGDLNGDGIIESSDYSWISNKVRNTFSVLRP